MLDFEVSLGPFRLSLRLGDAPDGPPSYRETDLFSTAERAPMGFAAADERPDFGSRGRPPT